MDGWIYLFHSIFWGAFFARAFRKRRTESGAPRRSPVASTSSLGKTVLAILVFIPHGIAFGVMYGGIAAAVGSHKHFLFELPWPVGALTISLGAAIIAWALYVFESWRCLAKLDTNHKLCTRGPYGLVRHPIYLACDLLAFGSFLWLPTVATGIGVIAMFLTGDLRARREERVLRETFGDEYRVYEDSVKRYVPGLY